MRVVIDTNVFVGACLGVGASSAVIRACLEHRIVPLMGETLFTEFEAVMGRDALFAKSRLNAKERSASLTVRLPDEKHRRLKALAKSRGTPLNRLIEDMTTVMLAEFDAETRFQLRASRGAGQEATGLKLLDKAKAS